MTISEKVISASLRRIKLANILVKQDTKLAMKKEQKSAKNEFYVNMHMVLFSRLILSFRFRTGGVCS
jgi:hypothetical protein